MGSEEEKENEEEEVDAGFSLVQNHYGPFGPFMSISMGHKLTRNFVHFFVFALLLSMVMHYISYIRTFYNNDETFTN